MEKDSSLRSPPQSSLMNYSVLINAIIFHLVLSYQTVYLVSLLCMYGVCVCVHTGNVAFLFEGKTLFYSNLSQ